MKKKRGCIGPSNHWPTDEFGRMPDASFGSSILTTNFVFFLPLSFSPLLHVIQIKFTCVGEWIEFEEAEETVRVSYIAQCFTWLIRARFGTIIPSAITIGYNWSLQFVKNCRNWLDNHMVNCSRLLEVNRYEGRCIHWIRKKINITDLGP